MTHPTWSPEQYSVITAPANRRTFLEGPAGSGKTSAAVERLCTLVASGIPAESILILVPQRTLAQPYFNAIRSAAFPNGGLPEVVTLGGLSQRLTGLFWPIIARHSGFAHPNRQPTFLTLESAQYYLSRIVQPLIDEGFFESISMDSNRLLSQILDNLNKTAAVGYAHTEIAERLSMAWIGEKSQVQVYQDAQECANRFRQFCLQNNLLDFSLQFEILRNHLWPSFLCRQYFYSRFRHLIFDNIEEDVPVTHDLVREWLPNLDSALLIYDTNGGLRSFLGADPESGLALQSLCEETVTLSHSWVCSPALDSFRNSLGNQILRKEGPPPVPELRSSVRFIAYNFLPQMIEGIGVKISDLINVKGVAPGEIAVLAPFLSDSLRFSLMNRLDQLGIPCHSHRPSRSLRDEPATRCLLTLARLAHPVWNLPVTRLELRSALVQTITGLDLMRADLLSQIVFRRQSNNFPLSSFDQIRPEMQDRISYSVGERYEIFLAWLKRYLEGENIELDIFLSRLFGELLSQPGFGFHNNFDAASVAARLIESIQKFRLATTGVTLGEPKPLGLEYIQMVQAGVVAAQYIQTWFDQPEDSVFIAPAYTFLMSNRPVSYQFWLDIGSQGWWERLYQPLTHPFILSRHWIPGQVWTDAHEFETNQRLLTRLVSGLILRCRQGIFLCFLGVNEQGREQRGLLLTALQNIQRRLPPEEVQRV